LLVDADPQNSAGTWAATRSERPSFNVIGLAQNTLHRDLPEIAKDYDHVVIDSPPRVSAIARSAILACDLVIIPVQPSSYDIWAAGETVELVTEAKSFKPTLQACFLINRKIVNSVIGEEIKTVLADFNLPVLPIAITQRVAFAESSAGTTVMEISQNSSASKEIKALSKAILKLMEMKSW
jgi:chromosome partitioning protein